MSMLKYLMTSGILLMGSISFAQTEGNYVLIINNDSIQVDLNNKVQYKTPAGEALTIEIFQPDILRYSDDMISFSHDKSLSVSNTAIDTDIEQCVMMRSTGNGFMIQKYRSFDPSSLTRFMLNEITKESLSYGYAKTEREFTRELKSGQTIEGIEATLTYRGEKEVYTVASYGGKDEGILVVTMLLSEEFPDDKEIIELFLNTLEFKAQ